MQDYVPLEKKNLSVLELVLTDWLQGGFGFVLLGRVSKKRERDISESPTEIHVMSAKAVHDE